MIVFLSSKLENQRFCIEWYEAFPDFILLLISSWMEFWFFRIVPKYLNYSAFVQGFILYLYIVILSCILISRYDSLLVLSAISSIPICLLATDIMTWYGYGLITFVLKFWRKSRLPSANLSPGPELNPRQHDDFQCF